MGPESDGAPGRAPYESIVSQVVSKIRNEPLLFIVAVAALLIGLMVVGTRLGSSDLRFIVSVIAVLAAAGILGYYVLEVMRIGAKPATAGAPAEPRTDRAGVSTRTVGPDPAALTLYDSRHGFDPFVFRAEPAEGGLGRLTFRDRSEDGAIVKDGIWNLFRENTSGRIVVWLESYAYPQGTSSVIPRNADIQGKRGLRVRCEARVLGGGQHTLILVVRDLSGVPGRYMGRWIEKLTSDAWTTIDAYLPVSPLDDCRLRLDDVEVSQPRSSLQIKDLVLTERIP